MKLLLGLLLSYVLGSIPTAFWAGKIIKGIDIRQHGSGNVGATNAFRVLGKWPGLAVFAIDVLKGVLAVVVVGDLLGLMKISDRVFLAVAVVCGHNWTFLLQFKGGKGIATSLGVLIGLTLKVVALRTVLLTSILVWAVVFLSSGYVSLASIAAAVTLPLVIILTVPSIEIVLLGVVFCLFIVLRHRPNIKRLANGTESRVSLPYFKKKK